MAFAASMFHKIRNFSTPPHEDLVDLHRTSPKSV